MKALFKALADFQQEVPAIFKGTSGFNYKYAELSEILEVINPLLKKHGLGFTQLLDGTSLKTIIFHSESGEAINGSVDIPQGVKLGGMNDFQILGSAITYLRRYSLAAALGLVTDSDNDAQGKQEKPKTMTKDQEQAIRNLARQKKYTPEEIETNLNAIKTEEQATLAIRKLQQSVRD